MKLTPLLRRLFVGFGLLLGASQAAAQIVTIEVHGTIYDSYTYLGTGLPTIMPVGSNFTATFVYDPATAVAPYAGSYGPGGVQTSTIYGFTDFTATFSANGYTFTAPIGTGGTGITVYDLTTGMAGYDGIRLSGRTSGVAAPTQNTFYLNSISLQLLNANLNTFADQALSHVSEGASFTTSGPVGVTNMIILSAQSPSSVSYLTELYGYASSYSYSVAAVPEPSTYAALAGLGALGFVLCRRLWASALARATNVTK